MLRLFITLLFLSSSPIFAMYLTQHQENYKTQLLQVTINNITGTLLEHYEEFTKNRSHFSKTDFLRYTGKNFIKAYPDKNDCPQIKEAKRQLFFNDILNNNFIWVFPYRMFPNGEHASRYRQAIIFGTQNQEICKLLHCVYSAHSIIECSHDDY